MNKKGFISITVIYSFFLVFLTLMMLIIVNMVSNRNLLNGMKKAIKEDINSSQGQNDSNYVLSKVNNFTYIATSSSLTITASVTSGSSDITKYLFSIDNGSTYKESTTNTYTFSGLSVGTTYTIMVKVKDSSNKESEVYSGTAQTSTITLADVCSSGTNSATCIKTFANQGPDVSKIYYHNGALVNGISDGSYRYAGLSSEVNNYVCFGSDEVTCPENNLYRIIGVFNNQIKLIKATSIGGMKWNSSGSSTWSTSSLSSYLNGEYLTSLGDFATKIATTTWKVGGNTYDNIAKAVPATAYTNEITIPVTTYSAKIGLMYVSDYGFAADPSAWTTMLRDYSSYKNWMALGSIQWTISRIADDSNEAFRVISSGSVYGYSVIYSYAIRPVFYLNSSVTYSSGSGTSLDPIRIN